MCGTTWRAAAGAAEPDAVLVIDDSRTQRLLISALLRRRGLVPVEAESAEAGLAILARRPVRLVLCDWVMPGMSGPDFCRAVRAGTAAMEEAAHIHVILLTAKQAREDIAHGLGAGADDFISKPVDEVELVARLRAGQRIVEMQGRLQEGRAELAAAYASLKTAHETLDRDLAMAGLLQAEFLPPGLGSCNGARCATLYRPLGHVGGDLVGYFPVGARSVGVYSLDVCGHGVAAALRSVQLSQLLTPSDPAKNIAFRDGPAGREIRDPAATARELNARCLAAAGHEVYFTLALAVIDLDTGAGRLCLAGHCPALILGAGRHGPAPVRAIGAEGPPIGLLPDLDWRSTAFELGPGERLLLHSDGLVEVADAEDGRLGATALAAMLADHAAHEPDAVIDRLLARIEAAAGPASFADDVSAVILERPGESAARALAG